MGRWRDAGPRGVPPADVAGGAVGRGRRGSITHGHARAHDALCPPRDGARRTPELDHASHARACMRACRAPRNSDGNYPKARATRKRQPNSCSRPAKPAKGSVMPRHKSTRASGMRTFIAVVSILCASAQTAAQLTPGAHALKDILPMIPGELVSEYRTRLALEQVHADDRRRAELSELTATTNAPDARIRAWERTHGLSLPRSCHASGFEFCRCRNTTDARTSACRTAPSADARASARRRRRQ